MIDNRNSNALSLCEQVVAPFGSLDEFLSHSHEVERYFLCLQAYYGTKRLSRAAFDAILSQLVALKKRVPLLAERLWEKDGLGQPIVIDTNSRAFGRRLESEEWQGYLQRWLEELRTNCQGLLQIPSDETRRARVGQILTRLESAVADLERSGAAGAAYRQIQSRLFQALRSDSDLRAVASYLLLRQLEAPAARRFLDSREADLVLFVLGTLKQQPTAFLPVLGLNAGRAASYIKELVPDLKTLLQNRQLFPDELRETKEGRQVALGKSESAIFRLQPVERRFHAIWKGATVMDCVGGAPDYLNGLTPRRWAVPALSGVQLYHLERLLKADGPGQYIGFIQLIPIRHRGRGKTYASVEFFSTVFFRRLLPQSLPVGQVHSTSLFEMWLERAMADRPPEWDGFVVSESNALNTDGVLDMLRSCPEFLYGERLGADGFEIADPLAHQIERHAPEWRLGRQFGKGMIFDAVVPDAETLTVLAVQPPGSKVQEDESRLTPLLTHPAVRWRAALALLKRDPRHHLALKTLTEEFLISVASPLQRLYEPGLQLLQRQVSRALNQPLRAPKTSSLWRETATELGRCVRYHERRLGESAGRLGDESAAVVTGALAALKAAARFGRTQEVRAASARALGSLDRRDPELVDLFVELARVPHGYRRRIMTEPARLGALHAMGSMGWDHPAVLTSLMETLAHDEADMLESRLSALEAIRRIRPRVPVVAEAVGKLLLSANQKLRNLAAETLRHCQACSEDEIQRRLALGRLRDPMGLVDEKVQALTHLSSQPRIDAELLETLRLVAAADVSEPVRNKASEWLARLDGGYVPSRRRDPALVRVLGRSYSKLTLLKVALALAGLVELIAIGSWYRSFNEYRSVGNALERSHRLQLELYELHNGVHVAEAAHRNFIVNGAPYFLDRYQIAVEHVARSFTDLRTKLPRERQVSLQHAERLFGQKLSRMGDALETARRAGTDAALDALRDSSVADRNRELARSLDELIELERKHSRDIVRERRAVTLFFVIASFSGNLLSCLILCLVGYSLWKSQRQQIHTDLVLRESEERLRLLMAQMTDQIWFMVSPDGKVLSCNAAAQSRCGYTEPEIVGQHFSQLFTKKDARRGIPAHALRVARTEGQFETVTLLTRRDSTPLPARFVVKPVRDAESVLRGFFVVISGGATESSPVRQAA